MQVMADARTHVGDFAQAHRFVILHVSNDAHLCHWQSAMDLLSAAALFTIDMCDLSVNVCYVPVSHPKRLEACCDFFLRALRVL
jgi:hypothetical protein